MIDSYNQLKKLLLAANVSESEQAVYLAGLEGCRLTADFQAKLRLPRSTVTTALRGLQDCSLCIAEPINQRTYSYTMQPIERLNEHLSTKASSLHALMDDIASYQPTTSDLRTQQVEGQEAVQQLLELALRCKTRKWHIIATKENPIKYMPKNYTEYFKKVRNDRQIESLSLWDSSNERSLGLHELLMRKPRYIPKNITEKIPGLLLAFDSSLLLIEGKDQPSAVLIESQAISQTYKIIFEMAWRLVKPS